MLSGLTAVSEIDGLPVKKINFGHPRRVRLQGSKVSPLPFPAPGAFHTITVLASHVEAFSEVVRHRLLNLYQLDVYKNV